MSRSLQAATAPRLRETIRVAGDVSAGVPPEITAALKRASALHSQCNREPTAGLAAVQSELAAREARDGDAIWGPLIDAALANAATAAEHKLGLLPQAARRARQTADALRKHAWINATPAWNYNYDRILAITARLLAVVLDDQGEHAAALPWHREAIAIFERRDDRLNQAKQWHNLSILYGRTMLFAEALQALRRSAELQKDIPDVTRFREFMTWTDQAELCVEMGDYETAEQAALRGVDTTSTEGPIFGRGEPHAVLGAARLALGRIDEAEQAFGEARRRFEKLGHRVGLAHVLHGLARVAAAREGRKRACQLEHEAIALARECGTKTDAAKFLCQLGRFVLEQGDTDAALRHGREALECSVAATGIIPSELEARRLIADVLAAQGDTAGALAAHREFHERFAAAHDARKTMQSRVLAAQYQLDLAQRDAAHARLESARLSEALAEVAARLDSVRSRGIHVVPKEVTAESFRPLGLSRRESEVLLWVARGKTNDEVAMILGCGAETVKSHLKRIYQQLDVTNRAAAAARAVEFSAGGVMLNDSP